MKLTQILSERLIAPNLKARNKLGLIDELAHLIARVHEDVNAGAVAKALLDRERISSTAVGHGVAIPHARTSGTDGVVGCLGLSREGVDFDSEDGRPTHIFFVLVAPEVSAGEHLALLAQIARLCRSDTFRRDLLAAESAHSAYEVIREAEAAE